MKHTITLYIRNALLSVLWLSSLSLQGQLRYHVRGQIVNSQQIPVNEASISIEHKPIRLFSDSLGYFQLKDLSKGTYTITINSLGYQNDRFVINLERDTSIRIVLIPNTRQLDEVAVTAKTDPTFGIRYLNAVEGTNINAGKKSEVIVLDDEISNKAANNTRQIYARIAGLNIWENDGAGIQLGIGGRGLNPSRVTNFNTRQNGYDISADALGYPESYYTPPAELTDRIEILRGASSLQYGTQFGGLINFKLKEGPTDKTFQFTSRETVGSWGFINTTNSVGGTAGKWRYYSFFQHKQGDGWRPNAEFNVNTAHVAVNYQWTTKLSLGLQYTYMDYLAHQPGGLTDAEFADDPHQSVRERNWFKVNWNLLALLVDYQLNNHLKINSRFFGLAAGRDALGNLDYINRVDPGADRDLYKDQYRNYGNETRLLYTYAIGAKQQDFLLGFRYYHGHTDRQQGLGNNGSTGHAADFEFVDADDFAYSDYVFPNDNIAFFAEHIFRLTPKFSVIPGLRYEHISTSADGFYSIINRDQAGNIIFDQRVQENRDNNRQFLIGGIGLSYIPSTALHFYANFSQNYRAINFNDIRSVNPNIQVDPNLQDEKGYSADLGLRGNLTGIFHYDVNVFLINYDNRIGTVQQSDPVSFNVYRYRTNVSQSRNYGLESFAELELLHFFHPDIQTSSLSLFTNLALIHARYIHSQEPAYENKKVELAPDVIFKTGLTWRYKRLAATYQLAYTGSQFTDATNATFTGNAIDGLVPAYTVMDLSAQYQLGTHFSLEGSMNNLANARYFTRRADSYPGPGIIPADARAYFLTLQFKW